MSHRKLSKVCPLPEIEKVNKEENVVDLVKPITNGTGCSYHVSNNSSNEGISLATAHVAGVTTVPYCLPFYLRNFRCWIWMLQV